MKQNGWILVIVLLVLAFGLIDTPIKPSGFLRPLVGKWIGGLTEEARPTPTIQTDTPTLRSDEVCALVYNYLEARASLVSSIGLRQPLLTALAIARPYFTATYQDNGKWQVSGLGYGLKDEKWVFNYDGLWNLYEASRAIEPANDHATALLLYMARLSKTSTSITGSANIPTPSPSQSSQRQYYLRWAEYYQENANTNLDMANMALSSANFHLRMSQTGSGQDVWMRLYQSDMESYQRYMKQYASDQQMANEYLLKAQREP